MSKNGLGAIVVENVKDPLEMTSAGFKRNYIITGPGMKHGGKFKNINKFRVLI